VRQGCDDCPPSRALHHLRLSRRHRKKCAAGCRANSPQWMKATSFRMPPTAKRKPTPRAIDKTIDNSPTGICRSAIPVATCLKPSKWGKCRPPLYLRRWRRSVPT